jgi:hypothetical protein
MMRAYGKGIIAVMVLLAAFMSTMALAGLSLTSGTVLQGEVVDKKGTRFPGTIRITNANDLTGDFVGEVSWHSLNSVHKIEGRVKGNTVVFKETAYIRQGGAHLNCEYALVFDGQTLQGRWVEPGVDTGSANFAVQR